ncbi:MAG: type II toxin-antitoxin system Phd/YefM family antitoxin [Azonexus sp.]|jgi:prevent-host-death family protein|nr:type II toxin-antitoxin system Phd/YefM family antitoxin [Azonexus sp.]
MKTWSVLEAKMRFSELLNTCLSDGPQLVTRRGAEAAVLVPAQVWQQMQMQVRPSLKQWLLAPEARTDELVPKRGRGRRRQVESIA